MSNITDFLQFDSIRFGQNLCGLYGLGYEQEVRFKTEIVQIDSNPYYFQTKEKVSHYEFRIKNIISFVPENTEDVVGILPFKMTSYFKKPTIEQFSDHIKRECLATLKALKLTDKYVWEFHIPEWREITPIHVYNYIKEIHKSYEKTEDFLKVWDFYLTRIYNNAKWIESLVKGGRGILSETTLPIGEHLFAFLEIGKYCDYYELSKSV